MQTAAPDLKRMGLEVLSFTIKDITDDVEYLSSLGKERIAEVKSSAAIGIPTLLRMGARHLYFQSNPIPHQFSFIYSLSPCCLSLYRLEVEQCVNQIQFPSCVA